MGKVKAISTRDAISTKHENWTGVFKMVHKNPNGKTVWQARFQKTGENLVTSNWEIPREAAVAVDTMRLNAGLEAVNVLVKLKK